MLGYLFIFSSFSTGSAWLKLGTEIWWSRLICQKLCCWNFLLLTRCWWPGSITQVGILYIGYVMGPWVDSVVCDLLFVIHLLSLIKKNCQLVPPHTHQAFNPPPMLYNFYAFHTSKHWPNDFVYSWLLALGTLFHALNINNRRHSCPLEPLLQLWKVLMIEIFIDCTV